uniref:SCP domain-containing protein n=1 Tax=Brugia timori TaxID=42155 RepID=A0A0R3R5V6_9BILA
MHNCCYWLSKCFHKNDNDLNYYCPVAVADYNNDDGNSNGDVDQLHNC